MNKIELIEKMKNGLIVSCQSQVADPIHTDDIVVIMAKAAKWAGAVAIRANSPQQIKAIKKEVALPIIGLYKIWHEDSDVFITPNMKAVDEIVEAGADIIALDTTFQLNHEGIRACELLKEVKAKYPNIPIFSDISNIEEARYAISQGADIVAPTLYGYTKETKHIEEPDLRMFASMCREFKDQAYVMMEGHLYTPEDAMKAIYLGAHSVVVGSAITRPHLTAKRFVDLLSGYNDNWREAETKKVL